MEVMMPIFLALVPLIVVLWLIKRFIDIADDIHYLANRARLENGDEVPRPSRTVAVVAVVLIIATVAYGVYAHSLY